MCDNFVSKKTFMLKYCLNRYMTQEMCDKAVDAFPPILKFIPDWFVLNKMLDKNLKMLYSLIMIWTWMI